MRTANTTFLNKLFNRKMNVLLALSFLVFTLFYRNQGMIKAIAVNGLRETVKISLDYKTRDWKLLEGKHFLLKYSAEDDDAIASLVLQTIEKDYQKVNKILQYEPKSKSPIVMYPNKNALNKSFGWDANENAMGVYWAGVIQIVSPKDWMQNTSQEAEFAKNGPMVHEYAHLLVDYKTGGNYTRWFTEGIAQYVEKRVTGFVFPEVFLNSKPEFYSIDLLTSNFDNLENQQLAYSESLEAIEYLVNNYGKNSLQLIMEELYQGKSMPQALQRVTGVSFESFQEGFQEYFLAKHLN